MKYAHLIMLLFLIVSCSSIKTLKNSNQLRGTLVNLEETGSKKTSSVYKLSIKENKQIIQPNQRGKFTLNYPKTGGTLRVLTNDDYAFIEKEIPLDAKNAIVFVDELREMISFVTKGQNIDKQYNIALKEFETITPIYYEQYVIFPGCEESSNYKNCFNKMMSKHVAKNFELDLIGLPEGRKSIYILFDIDKNGEINITEVKSPHPQLKREALRVMKKLPAMQPAMKRNKPIKIKYTLPIRLDIQ